jgi:hypothetical protein
LDFVTPAIKSFFSINFIAPLEITIFLVLSSLRIRGELGYCSTNLKKCKLYHENGKNRSTCSFVRSEERKEKTGLSWSREKKTGTFLLAEATQTSLGGTAFGAPHAMLEGQILKTNAIWFFARIFNPFSVEE